MPHRVVFSPEARTQLVALYRYIANVAGADTADDFTSSLVEYCAGFETFPQRGTARDDIRPGLRTIGFRHRVTIAFAVTDEGVTILGIFYGGRDYEAALRDDADI
jgi:toxin ParE1/3/4